MENNEEVLKAISNLKEEMQQAISNLKEEMQQANSNLKEEMQIGFRSVNKRLDGIENELRKIDTILRYQEQYNNIPS